MTNGASTLPGEHGEDHAGRVTVEKDGYHPQGRFDVILANINKHIILRELAVMRQQ